MEKLTEIVDTRQLLNMKKRRVERFRVHARQMMQEAAMDGQKRAKQWCPIVTRKKNPL